MGLDGVELVMAVEERFGIEISDEEAPKLRTPALLTEFVAKKLDAQKSEHCATQRAFCRLRRAAMETFQIRRKQVRTDTRLEELFQPENRRELWDRFGWTVGAIAWPKLEYPWEFSGSVLTGVAVIVGLSGFFLFLVIPYPLWVGWLIAFSLWAAITTFVFQLARRFRTRFPERAETFGDLSRRLVLTYPELLEGSSRPWTREDVRLVVREIICEQLGLANDFDDQADFVDDLGVD
jgi:acyl carrier protein